MKKVAAAVLMATGLMAADSGVYIGADVGNTATEMTITLNGSSSAIKDDGGSQTYKIGYYVDQNNRVNAFYQRINVDGGNASSYGVGYDYLIGDSAFKPFVGVLLGHGSMKVDETPVDIAGIIYGAQAGLNYALNKNFSAEAGYRIMKSEMKDSISGLGGTATFEIDPIKNWFIGVNYKF